MSDGLVEDLRNEDIARGTSAMVMRCQAADEIERLQRERDRAYKIGYSDGYRKGHAWLTTREADNE